LKNSWHSLISIATIMMRKDHILKKTISFSRSCKMMMQSFKLNSQWFKEKSYMLMEPYMKVKLKENDMDMVNWYRDLIMFMRVSLRMIWNGDMECKRRAVVNMREIGRTIKRMATGNRHFLMEASMKVISKIMFLMEKESYYLKTV